MLVARRVFRTAVVAGDTVALGCSGREGKACAERVAAPVAASQEAGGVVHAATTTAAATVHVAAVGVGRVDGILDAVAAAEVALMACI